jgi:hypothetical protein
MLQKYRVFCPHCSASLLVTEDLMGTAGNCPGCKKAFQLPSIEELLEAEAGTQAPHERPAPSDFGTPMESPIHDAAEAPNVQPDVAPFSSGQKNLDRPSETPVRTQTRQFKPVKIEKRTELRIFSSLLKIVAGLQVLACIAMLLTVLTSSMQVHPGTPAMLVSIFYCVVVGLGAVPTYAFAELILVFVAQEELLRHILNDARQRASEQ